MTDATPRGAGKRRQLVKEALEVVNGPVIFGLNAGHRGDSITLPMNAPVRLSAKGTDICFQMI